MANIRTIYERKIIYKPPKPLSYMKLILIVIALLTLCILWAVIENIFHKRKSKKKREKDEPNVHSKRQIEYYKGENKPDNKVEHDWIEFHLN